MTTLLTLVAEPAPLVPGRIATLTWWVGWSEDGLEITHRPSGQTWQLGPDDKWTLQLTRAVTIEAPSWWDRLVGAAEETMDWLHAEVRAEGLRGLRLSAECEDQGFVKGLPGLAVTGEVVDLSRLVALARACTALPGGKLAVDGAGPRPMATGLPTAGQYADEVRKLEAAHSQMRKLREGVLAEQKERAAAARRHELLTGALEREISQAALALNKANEAREVAEQARDNVEKDLARRTQERDKEHKERARLAQKLGDTGARLEALKERLRQLESYFKEQEEGLGNVKTLTEHNLAEVPSVEGSQSFTQTAGVACPACKERGEEIEMYRHPLLPRGRGVEGEPLLGGWTNRMVVTCARCGHMGTIRDTQPMKRGDWTYLS